MTWLEAVGVSVVSALVTSGLLITVLRRIALDYLDRRQLAATRDIEFRAEQRESFFSSRFVAYPELFEMCYRSKAIADEYLSHGDLSSKRVEEFGKLVSHLTEKLFEYRLYVPEDVWRALHGTKHVCQDLLARLDVLGRVDLDKKDAGYETGRSDASRLSRELAGKIDNLDRLLRASIESVVGDSS